MLLALLALALGALPGPAHQPPPIHGPPLTPVHAPRALCSRRRYHNSLVRDCSWHPLEPELATVSWDGSVVAWGVESRRGGQLPSMPGEDAFDGL